MTVQLPIDDVLDELQAALATHPSVLLIAEPGAGKTTRVPLALRKAGWLGERRIIMLEPRRLAARNAARFMASQLQEQAGGTVGYRMKMEQKVSATTRIEVVTEGILTRMLQDDPELSDVGLIIFDEFHERHLNSDLGLALVRQCQQVFNPDLKLLVMSATLDDAALSEMLDAPVIRSAGRACPVTTHYRPARDANERLTAHVLRVTGEALRSDQGDILVFLPGSGDISRVLENAPASDNVVYLPLHGQLSDNEQKLALQADDQGRRKVILATNIAESSLTIDGVRIVIDSGLERRMLFRPSSGLSELVTQGISQASATQRQGRAGRQAEGVCYRLFGDTSFSQRPAHIRPEIGDSDLSGLVTELLQWGADASELEWLTTPPAAHLSQAVDVLELLGIVADGQLTAFGRRALALNTDPRLAVMILLGAEAGMGQAAAALAALLQEPALLRNTDDLPRLIQQLQQKPVWNSRIIPVARRWHKELNLPDDSSPADYGYLLACAYPERIGRQRNGSQPHRYQLANGAGAELNEDSSLIRHRWLATADISAGQPNRIRLAAALEESTLERLSESSPARKRHIEIRWQDNGQLLAEEQERLGALVIKARKISQLSKEDWLLAWRDQFAQSGLTLLEWDDAALQLRGRMHLAHEYQPEQFPDVSDTALLGNMEEWLEPWLADMRNLRDLKKLATANALQSLLSWDKQQQLNQLLPTHISVPSGSSIAIDYNQTPPVLAVKLQEMFGYEGQPSVLNGQLPLLIHLLSPARRPLQITQDLPHFWRHTYADVRKDMRGRYPKHPWPEDPLEAVATRHTKRYSKD